MIKVIKTMEKMVPSGTLEYYFETLTKAINFVSGEYIYYEKKYVDKEKFNCCTTQTREPDWDNDDTEYPCEPYDMNLRWAYMDMYDGAITWKIDAPLSSRIDVYYLKQLFEEQNYTDEEFDVTSFESVKDLAHWLEYCFEMFEASADIEDYSNPNSEPRRYAKAIYMLIHELENKER